MEELWEAGYWLAHGVLAASAYDWQRNELRALIGPDRGLGDRELRQELTALLNQPLPDPSPTHRRLKGIIGHVRAGCLQRWATVSAPIDKRVKPEQLSRTVAAHWLDPGCSSSHLQPLGTLQPAGAVLRTVRGTARGPGRKGSGQPPRMPAPGGRRLGPRLRSTRETRGARRATAARACPQCRAS